MIIRYWGVRGSMPVPGPSTLRYGGNTACVSVRRGDSLLVIDAGTGIVGLGEKLDRGVREVVVLLTHRHMDHAQGLPFFEPLYGEGPSVALLDVGTEEGWWSPLALFDGVGVPMRPGALGRRVERVAGDPVQALRARGWEVEGIDLRHPGGSLGVRLQEQGASFVHLTDTDLGARGEAEEFFERCAEFCRGADVLSHDAQYVESEMPERRGRGHSTVERVCDLAVAAGVRRLVLFHHDPGRDDDALDAVGRMAAERVGKGIEVEVAREGLEVGVGYGWWVIASGGGGITNYSYGPGRWYVSGDGERCNSVRRGRAKIPPYKSVCDSEVLRRPRSGWQRRENDVVGWAKRSVPILRRNPRTAVVLWCRMGTLRFAHPTGASSPLADAREDKGGKAQSADSEILAR